LAAASAPGHAHPHPFLPGAVGDAALTVDPTDEAALAGAIRQALTDEPPRAQPRAAGLARAVSFSWERTAAETLGVYQAIIGSSEG
jgi:alpha-1,3-rhamnosyl/mannosyltransferase